LDDQGIVLADETQPRNNENGDSRFVEYEISCHMAVRLGNSSYQISGNIEERSWSVWKRYSEFKELDDKIHKSFGWQINALNNGWGVSFPSGHVLSSILVGNLDKSFVEQRRFELAQYWQSIEKVKEMFDFANPSSHRYPRDMSTFLEVDNNFSGRNRGHVSSTGDDEGTNAGRDNSDISRNISQTSFHPSSKDSASPAMVSSHGNEQLNDGEEDTADLCSQMKDIVFDSESVSSLRDTPRRRIGGAKSAFQRSHMDSF